MKRRTRPVRHAVVGLVAATLVAGALTLAPSTPVAPQPAAAAGAVAVASDAGCLDDRGNAVTCPIELDPMPLPVGQTIGENELGLVSRATDGSVKLQPYEWQSGGEVGACVPGQSGCSLTNRIRVGAPIPDPGDEQPVAPLPGADGGDAAVTAEDFDGDGRQDLVAAALCAGSQEICLSMYEPAEDSGSSDGYRDWFPTGLEASDAPGAVGTIRLASGLLLRTQATIERATFGLGIDGGVQATFTTSEPHGFIPGQPVRLEENADLAEAMCPALAAGSVLCGSGLSADFLPVASTPTDTTFTLAVGGTLVVTAEGAGDEDVTPGPQLPPAWPNLSEVARLAASVSATATTIDVIETSAPTQLPFDILVDNERMTVTKRVSLESGSDLWRYSVRRSVGSATTHDGPVDGDPGASVVLPCAVCGVGITGIRPGLTMAYEAPAHAASLATFSVALSPTAAEPFRLVDNAAVGTMSVDAQSRAVVDDDEIQEIDIHFGNPAGLYRFRFAGKSSATMLAPHSGSMQFYTASALENTIEAIPGFEGTVTVEDLLVDPDDYHVYFKIRYGGVYEGTDVPQLTAKVTALAADTVWHELEKGGIPRDTIVTDVDGRSSLDLVAADFNGDGQEEVAVAYAAAAGGSPQGRLRFFAVNDAKQLVPLGAERSWGGDGSVAPYTVSLASGFLAPMAGSNTSGQDLVVGWGGRGHAFAVLDVSPNFGLRNVTLDETGGDSFVGDWDKDTSYAAGDVVVDRTGYWRALNSGDSSCTTTAATTKKLYFPVPNTALLQRIPGDVPADDRWRDSADPQVSGEQLLQATTYTSPSSTTNGLQTNEFTPPQSAATRAGGVYGYLEPARSSASSRQFVAAKDTLANPGPDDVLLGQYVSGPLDAQTITGSLSMFMESASWFSKNDSTARSQLVVKVVSNDGQTVRGTLYDGEDADVDADRRYRPYYATTSSGSRLVGGYARAFPPDPELPTVDQVAPVAVRDGDRLVVEFGVRTADTTSDAGSFIGTASLEDVPANEAATADEVAGRTAWLGLSRTLAMDDCETHFADTGVTWAQVDVPDVVSTWDNPKGADDLFADGTTWGERYPGFDADATVAAAGASTIDVGAADLDLDGLDEVVVAQTTPVATGGGVTTPLEVQVWRGNAPDCTTPVSPASSLACVRRGTMPFEMVTSTPVTSNARAIGPDGSGQLSLQLGRVGRSAIGDAQENSDAGFPNRFNSDIVLSWTCSGSVAGSCGRTATSPGTADGVAVQPIDVCIPAPESADGGEADPCGGPAGDPTWQLQPSTSSFVAGAPVSDDDVGRYWSMAPFALPDLDQNSATLGSPLEYLETGRLQPLLILRSPPVHYDAFDDDGDGWVDDSETWDVNNCFADYLLVGNNYVCDTDATYGTSSTVSSTIHGEVHNSATNSGGFGIAVSGGGGTQSCEREEGTVRLQPNSTGDGFKGGLCVEGSAMFRSTWSSGQYSDKSRTIGSSFEYTSTVTTSAGNDAVYAAVQQTQVLEYPIFAGAGWGLGVGDVVDSITQATPLETRFQWMSSEDFDVPLTSNGLMPQHILSYARTEDQIQSGGPQLKISSLAKVSGGAVDAVTDTNSTVACATSLEPQTDGLTTVTGSGTPDGKLLTSRYDGLTKEMRERSKTNQLDRYPCAVGNRPVSVTGTGTSFDRAYVVTELLSANSMRIRPAVPLPDSATTYAGGSSDARLRVKPGTFPVDEWTVRRYRELHADLSTNAESGYDQAYGWHTGLDLEFNANLNFAFAIPLFGGYGGIGLEGFYAGNYTHSELQTMTLATTQGTSFSIDISGNIKPNIAYRLKPYLTQSDNGPMVLDWTASANVLDTFWQKYYYELGPDPAFALPNLLTPYKAPYPDSRPRATAPNLMRTPDFFTWECETTEQAGTVLRVAQDCVPAPNADPAEPLVMSVRVHNYSLRNYDSSRPLQMAFYVGDPARGGYKVVDAEIPSVRDPRCVNRYCLPAQGEAIVNVPWDWARDYPALTGRGTALDPLPIYAIIDPRDREQEAHDFSEPVDTRDCVRSYPVIDSTDGSFRSQCPTTNNEAYYLQRFDGDVKQRTSLSVARSDLEIAPDGSFARVRVRAAADTGRVEVRFFVCAGEVRCTPQTSQQMGSSLTIAQIAANRSATKTIPLSLQRGRTYTVSVQVISRDRYEVPGGGPHDKAGNLSDNQTRRVATIGVGS